MSLLKKTIILTLVFQLFLITALAAAGRQELTMNNSFDSVDSVEIELVSSNVIIQNGTSNRIDIHLEYTYPEDRYNPTFTEKLIYIKTRVLFMHKLKKRGWNISPEMLVIILIAIILIIILFFSIGGLSDVLPKP